MNYWCHIIHVITCHVNVPCHAMPLVALEGVLGIDGLAAHLLGMRSSEYHTSLLGSLVKAVKGLHTSDF